jgi:hypothetical protein
LASLLQYVGREFKYIKRVDMKFLKMGVFSVMMSVSTWASATIINFDSYTLTGFATQDGSGNAQIVDGGTTLNLSGNTWKSLFVNISVNSTTIMYFDFKSTSEGELHGIGLDNDNNVSAATLFELFGTESNSTIDAFSNYSLSDGWKSYSIDIGSFFTGNFDRLVFINDKDQGTIISDSMFKNLEICDGCIRTGSVTVAAPSSMIILAISVLVFCFRRFKH